MPRPPAKEIPRWRRGKSAAQPQQVIHLRGRNARIFTREVARLSQEPGRREPGRKEPATLQAAANDLLATTGAWRFRRHVVPFAWLVFLLACTGLQAAPHPLLCGLAASVVIPGLMVLFTRHMSEWTRRAVDVAALVTSVWLPFLATVSLRSLIVWLLLTWAPLAGLWVRHYRWRSTPREQQAAGPVADQAVWERLAARRKWVGTLGKPEEIPGGRKWEIQLDGVETHIGQVMAEPRAIAAAWHRPRTEVYVEPHPTAIESRGILTLLDKGTLEHVQEWDGQGFGEDGIARIGRFADSQNTRIRAWVPMDGTRHGLVAGASGAGKSALLDLLCWLAITSPVPVVPIILDPQNGQSLPQWQDKLLYAAGVEECMRMLRGLNAGMMDRSRRLAAWVWDDNGHRTKGMEFFDPQLTGLPVVMPIIDESPLVLSGGGNAKLAAEAVRLEGEAAKLGRKTGRSEWLVAQVPSLSELGDQALRSMLVGGNVVCLRTGDKVSAGMLGLEADPSSLPKYFPDGEPTGGLGYAVSIDGRQAPFRSDIVPRSWRHKDMQIPRLDDAFLEAMDAAMGTQGVLFPKAGPAQLPDPEPEEAPEGRRCIDAVWLVLSDRRTEMSRGEIIQWVNDLATGAWGREKPFTIKSVGDALRDLVDGKEPGRPVLKPRNGVYRAGSEKDASC